MSETKPVTLWRTAYNRFYNDGDTVGGNGLYEEYRALPAAEFDALLARAEKAEAERDADTLAKIVALLGPAHDAGDASGKEKP